MCSPSATLAVWASAWLAGRAAPDDVLDALGEWAPMHLVGASDAETAIRTGLPWPDPEDTGVTLLLKVIREGTGNTGGELRLVLPVPGDVRGLPPGTEFERSAITAGEGILIGVPGRPGNGLVPIRVGPDVLQWTAFSATIPAVPAVEVGLGEAEYMMRQTVRDAADALTAVQRVEVDRHEFDARKHIEEQMADYARHTYPDSMSVQARRILQTADHVAAILAVAQRESVSLPTTAAAAYTRDETLRPLWSAVRTARLAAVMGAVNAR
jgi:hypothetical protein